MHQQFFLFIILLNCLLIKSKILVNTFPIQNLEFHYSHGEPQQTRIIRVETRLLSANGVRSFYSLNGHFINSTTLIVENVTVQYNNRSYPHSTHGSSYLSLEPRKESDKYTYLLRIENSNPDIRPILRNLSSKSNGTKKFNLTCILLASPSPSPNTNKPNPDSNPLSKVSLFGIIFLSICAVLVFGLCTLWLAVFHYRRFKQLRMNKKIRVALAKSTQQMLDKSPVIIFNPDDKTNDYGDDNPMCAICLESFKDKEEIRKLTCSHYYHISCIDPWLVSHQSCPLCNRNVLRNSIPTISSGVLAAINQRNNNETSVSINHDNGQTVQAQNSNL